MWETSLYFTAAIFLWVVSLMRRWWKPKCNGVLPPGSMGIPFIGETIQLLIPNYSLDTHPFITTRIKRHGPIFRTSLAGRSVVVSTDQEFNKYVIQQEGSSVELWYMDTFSKIVAMEGEANLNGVGEVHKYIRGTLLNQVGHTMMKKLLPDIQTVIQKSLEHWSTQPSVDVKKATSAMLFEFITKHLFSGYPFEDSPEIMSGRFSMLVKGLMAFPLNVPGTAFHECLKEHEELTEILKGILKDRASAVNSARRGDFLDEIVDGLRSKEFMNEAAMIQLIFISLMASFESVSTMIMLLLTLTSGSDRVFQELRAENVSIIGSGDKGTSCITWEQLKSLDFTNQVIKETLRLSNPIPGVFRRALQDIHVKRMTIPAGWTIMLVNSTVHMNSDLFISPLEFNPWRWKEIDPYTTSKNLMPFGGGMRQCVGADYSRVVMTIFLHVLVTNFRWTKIKGGEVFRNPVLAFKDGLHVKFSKYDEQESRISNIGNVPSIGKKKT